MVLTADMIARAPLGTTMQTMLARGNVGRQGAFETLAETSGVRPRSVREVLRRAPSHVQDRWHARLYFLRPALRIALALIWIVSGLAGLLHPLDQSARLLTQTGIAGAATAPLVYGASGVDIVLGLAVLAQFHTRIAGWLMFLSVIGYTFFLGIWMPALWFDPFGALIKNIVLFPAILVMIALEDQR
ncbi:MAG: DoxX-like family protein [Proteobacteria bacterium]|nr:DoxX-like family protein [Pseudomonadota bacterium]